MTILVSVTELWPEKFHCYIEPSMQEEILISYVCSKWGINSNLTKLDKLNAILEKLTKALNAKKEVDRRLEELLMNDQEDIIVFKDLINGEDWKNMQILMNEVLSDESRFCYMKIKEEIKQLEIISEEK